MSMYDLDLARFDDVLLAVNDGNMVEAVLGERCSVLNAVQVLTEAFHTS
jgi:hypothetical protein